jgi:uncharacterized membrane protein YcjF (UPF0283 family)
LTSYKTKATAQEKQLFSQEEASIDFTPSDLDIDDASIESDSDKMDNEAKKKKRSKFKMIMKGA